MHLAMTSDYVSSRGDASPYLIRLAEAGFTHVQWCHEWNTDHLYSPDEMTAIGRTLSELGLRLLDLHASHGVERSWGALDESRRHAGQEDRWASTDFFASGSRRSERYSTESSSMSLHFITISLP